ncbi:MAG: HNH endonuclease [Alphaproteobacteria bacterium]
MIPLTQSRLRELFDYDPLTGLFTRRVSLGGSKAGTVAGSLNGWGYVKFNIDGKPYKGHRLAFLWMNGKFPDGDVDHINRIRSDNRWANLREATPRQNNGNSSMSRKNTSGVKGVTWHKKAKKWQAQIGINGGTKHLGLFANIDDAAEAYQAASIRHFGGFAHAASSTSPSPRGPQ